MSETFKLCSLLLIILLGIACYHDLNRDPKVEPIITKNNAYVHYADKETNFQVISVRVSTDDHFLTIMEQINQYPVTNIEQSVTDFESLNPSANVYQLESERVYLFPIYQFE